MATTEIIADSNPDSRIVLIADEFVDVLKTVVPSGTASLAQAKGSERDVQVIGYYHEVFQRNVQFVHPVTHSFTAEIHVGGRLQKVELPALEGD